LIHFYKRKSRREENDRNITTERDPKRSQ